MEWTPISERIIQARSYSRYIKLTIIHIYAPTKDTDEQIKDELYGRLKDEHDILEKIPQSWKQGLIIKLPKKGTGRL